MTPQTPVTELPARLPATAGLILAGGRSSRMGVDKAALRFGGEPLLLRVLARLRQVAAPVVVALAPGQVPPALPLDVIAVRDPEQGRGPLWGMLAGFRALQGRARRVLLMPVDLPFFTPPWMVRLVGGLEGVSACLYSSEGFVNALTAAYDLALLPELERLVAEGRQRPIALSEGRPRHVLAIEELWHPALGAPPLMDMDTPEAYREALALEGIGAPRAPAILLTLRLEAPLPGLGASPAVPLRAATPAAAVAAAWRLFPELEARFRERGGWSCVRRGPPGSRQAGQPSIDPDAPLRDGEAVTIVLAGRS
ncbi:MAG: NTP transferase domain-containing protein [Candidatus Lambdaproteobacteria bacterium]|nr:NTP transferase domain-containing protein [Candidatus Lambdaproteobacteria bacterium]